METHLDTREKRSNMSSCKLTRSFLTVVFFLFTHANILISDENMSAPDGSANTQVAENKYSTPTVSTLVPPSITGLTTQNIGDENDEKVMWSRPLRCL